MSGAPIYKFGGTSLGDAARVDRVARLVVAADPTPVVVVSAPSGMTAALSRLADTDESSARAALESEVRGLARTIAEAIAGDELANELEALITDRFDAFTSVGPTDPAEARDHLLALGEDVSTRVMAAAIRHRGGRPERVDARNVIRTDAAFGTAEPDVEAIRQAAREHLAPVLEDGRIPIVQGFVGAAGDGRTTTLGRGGSDLTATLLGVALESGAVHIWTDVDGILTGDPRWVDRPRSLDVVGFEEAVELAWFGARVLHAGAAKHAVAHRLPVRVRSTFQPERPGTLVRAERWGGPDIAAVACKPAVALIQVRSRPTAMEYGFLAEVFGILAEHRTPVDLVATSHTSTAFTIDEGAELGALAASLDRVAEVDVLRGLSTVTVVGRGLLREPGFAARVFQTVAFTPVHLISQATDSSLSFLVDEAEAEPLVRRLHLVLIEGRTRRDEGDSVARETG